MAKDPNETYQVLARKYRPSTFEELIGQDAMVRILRHAFAEERVAQAYMLTGVRGVGKTTTARIIAKGLNCTGSGATKAVEPCGQCDSCIHVAEGRHMDVLELDAASRSQVNEMREILENVSFEPSEGRYRVYLIDEIHMLSTHAFNALLKTLEEPPEHVKFIFATTEIRKVPVTVLSRCQRFDLKRIDPPVMRNHLLSIASKENIPITSDAVDLIIRAAEGSVRDAVSLLDQVVGQGGNKIGAAAVREMLGLADRGRTLDLFELIMKGDAAGALKELNAQFCEGADPIAILRDLGETTHLISIVQVSPDTAQDSELSPVESNRSLELAKTLPTGALSRTWQMLLKAIEEASNAPSPMMAAEMALIRLCYVQDLPPASVLLQKLTNSDPLPLGGSDQTSPSTEVEATSSRQGANVLLPNEDGEEKRTEGEAESKTSNPNPALIPTEEADPSRQKLAGTKTSSTTVEDAFEKVDEERITQLLSGNAAAPQDHPTPELEDEQLMDRDTNHAAWQKIIPKEKEESQRTDYEKKRAEAREHELSQSVLKSFPNADIHIKMPKK